MSISNVAVYINDHLGGSNAALDLLKHLIDLKSGEEKIFYRKLHREITADQKILKKLLEDLREEQSLVKQIAGSLAEKAGRFKMSLNGMDKNDLGLFEALEILALGIQGKKLLWRALSEVSEAYPMWKNIPFEELEQNANEQHEKVERRRLRLAAGTLGVSGSRTSASGASEDKKAILRYPRSRAPVGS